MASAQLASIEHAICAWNRGDLEGYLALFHDDVTLPFLPPPLPQGKAGARVYFDRFLDGFRDLRIEVVNCIQQGDVVGARVRLRGTQTGAFYGIPPTRRTICIEGLIHLHFACSAVSECCTLFDSRRMMEQLGVLSD